MDGDHSILDLGHCEREPAFHLCFLIGMEHWVEDGRGHRDEDHRDEHLVRHIDSRILGPAEPWGPQSVAPIRR